MFLLSLTLDLTVKAEVTFHDKSDPCFYYTKLIIVWRLTYLLFFCIIQIPCVAFSYADKRLHFLILHSVFTGCFIHVPYCLSFNMMI
jgi:hypothetical protein